MPEKIIQFIRRVHSYEATGIGSALVEDIVNFVAAEQRCSALHLMLSKT